MRDHNDITYGLDTDTLPEIVQKAIIQATLSGEDRPGMMLNCACGGKHRSVRTVVYHEAHSRECRRNQLTNEMDTAIAGITGSKTDADRATMEPVAPLKPALNKIDPIDVNEAKFTDWLINTLTPWAEQWMSGRCINLDFEDADAPAEPYAWTATKPGQRGMRMGSVLVKIIVTGKHKDAYGYTSSYERNPIEQADHVQRDFGKCIISILRAPKNYDDPLTCKPIPSQWWALRWEPDTRTLVAKSGMMGYSTLAAIGQESDAKKMWAAFPGPEISIPVTEITDYNEE